MGFKGEEGGFEINKKIKRGGEREREGEREGEGGGAKIGTNKRRKS